MPAVLHLKQCYRPSASNKAIVTTKPFEIVGVDLLEIGVTSRGNRYIVTIIDHFTNLQASALLTKVRSRELKAKEWYDRHWKTDRTIAFNVGDRIYVKVPGEKEASAHPNCFLEWSNRVPSSIDDTPVISRKRRALNEEEKERWQQLLTMYHPLDVRFAPIYLLLTVVVQEYSMSACSQPRVIPQCNENPPLPELVFDSSLELARTVSILQTHIFAEWRAATLADHDYLTLSASSLGFAMSFFRAICLNLAAYHRRNLATDEALGNLPHPPRHTEDPFNLAEMVAEAQKHLPKLKTLIILPARFRRNPNCVLQQNPKDIQATWLAGEWSAVILFSPSYHAGVATWAKAWGMLLKTVARGAELILVAGPKDVYEWRKGIDMLRDLAEETIQQRRILAENQDSTATKSGDEDDRTPDFFNWKR
ncbi:hypothetical protein COOONC_16008 [Cooperia oncophora]